MGNMTAHTLPKSLYKKEIETLRCIARASHGGWVGGTSASLIYIYINSDRRGFEPTPLSGVFESKRLAN